MNETFAIRITTLLERGLKAVCSPSTSHQAELEEPSTPLSQAEKKRSVAFIRVNHAGEICAQGLYHGQALMSRDEKTFHMLLHWGDEEQHHLEWCAQRLNELGGKASVLNPFWYAGAFFLGCAVAPLPRRYAMGFIAETERQVMQHLQDHIRRLPSRDRQSIDLLQRICDEESQHKQSAEDQGGQSLPKPARIAMFLASRVFRELSYRF